MMLPPKNLFRSNLSLGSGLGGSRRSTSMALVGLLLLVGSTGCSRVWYREQADDAAYHLIGAAANDPRWALPDYNIYPNPASRFASEWPVDYPAMPPDDPTSHKLMQWVDNKKAYPWDRKFNHTPFVENPYWTMFLPCDSEGCLVLDQETAAVQAALLNNRDYQEQLEDLYLSALDVSFERFRFDSQFFGGNSVFYTADGRVRSGRPPGSSLLEVDSALEGRRLFASGGELLVGFANSMVWQYAGPNMHMPTTIFNFNFVQPLLRWGNRAQVLERLTISERTLLNNVRAMEQYRRGFYLEVVAGRANTGGPSRQGGLFGGAGLEGFSGVGGGFGRVGGAAGGGGFAGGAGAASAGGYLGLLQNRREISYQQDNVDQLCGSLRLMEEFFDAGRIDRLQLQLTRQSLYNAESRLKTSETAYESTLDQFKIRLGLPPVLCLKANDDLLDRFELIRSDLLDLRNRALLLRARMAVGPPRASAALVNQQGIDLDGAAPIPQLQAPGMGQDEPPINPRNRGGNPEDAEELPALDDEDNPGNDDPFEAPQPDLDQRSREIRSRARGLARLIEDSRLAVKLLDRARFLDPSTMALEATGVFGGSATATATTVYQLQRPGSLKQLQDDFQTVADLLDPTKGLLKQLDRLANFPYAVRVAPLLQEQSCERFGQVESTFDGLLAAKDARIRNLKRLAESDVQVRCDDLAKEAFSEQAFLNRLSILQEQVRLADSFLCGQQPWPRYEQLLLQESRRLPAVDIQLVEYFQRVRPLLVELQQSSEMAFLQLNAPENLREAARRRFHAAVEELRRQPLHEVRELLEQFVAPLTGTLDEVQNALDELAQQSSNLMLIEARSALEQIELKRVEMDEHEALRLAAENRLDWMNARSRLVDAWRLIEFNAKNLQGEVNVVFNGDIQNTGDNPFRLRSSNGRLQVGLEFDAPLTRLAERNIYRQSIIDYQQARRSFMAFTDSIEQVLRNELRTMRLDELNFELRRQAINVALDQVDLAQEGLFKPPRDETQTELGATAARDLVSALSDLLSVQNDFLSVWVNYEVLRRALDFDLGTMRLDAEGNWIDPGQDIGRVVYGPWCPPSDPLLRRNREDDPDFVPPLYEEIPANEAGHFLELREASWEKPPGRGGKSPFGAVSHGQMPAMDDSRRPQAIGRHRPSQVSHAGSPPSDGASVRQRTGLMGSPPVKLWRLFQ